MANTDQMQVRVSAEDKEKAREVFDAYGLSLSAAVRLFIRRSIQEGRLPFNFDQLPDRSASGERG